MYTRDGGWQADWHSVQKEKKHLGREGGREGETDRERERERGREREREREREMGYTCDAGWRADRHSVQKEKKHFEHSASWSESAMQGVVQRGQ